jgi:AbrB family looped-hinge helix DNA binding protein
MDDINEIGRMSIGKVGQKGQIVIPSALRKKYGIQNSTMISITDGEGVILIRPLYDDPISEGKGFLKGGSSLVGALMNDRDEESRK